MLQTILVFVVIPAAIYGVLGLLSMRSKVRPSRYKPGDKWEHEPVWFGPNPEALEHEPTDAADAAADTTLGGARGSW